MSLSQRALHDIVTSNMEDAEMVQMILARDKKALQWFYRTYTPKLQQFIRSRVHLTEDGEEILQDTLFGFLESLRDFHGKSSIKTFLFSICHNKIVDYYRRKRIKHIVFSQMPQLEMLISPLLNPEEEYDAAALREKINTVLGRLLPRYREILVCKYLENMPVSSIAERMAISFKSAESQLFRARKAFVEVFAVV